MENNQNLVPNHAPISEEMSLKELVRDIKESYRFLLNKWKIILLASLIGGGFGFLYSLWKKPTYTANATFVYEDAKNGTGSQFAGLAALAGVTLGNGGGGLFQGDNLLELYKSRTMLAKTLLSKGQFDGKTDLLINRYIQINKLRKHWAKSSKLKNLSFLVPKENYTRLHDSVLTAVISDINRSILKVEKPDKKLGIINVEVNSIDEQFAKVFSDRVVETVNQFYIETKTKKQNANIKILQRQADSVRRMLNAAIGGTAASLDANPNANPALQILRVPSQRKQVDVQANAAIYAEIVKNLEMSRLSALQDAPLIQMVDNAVFPLRKAYVGKIKGVLIGGIVFFFLTSMWLLLSRFLSKI